MDFASGSGLVTLELAKHVHPGKVTGVELSDELLEEALENKEKYKQGNVNFVKGNIYNLTLDENQFDFAYARFLFQHLENPNKAIENVLKVLKSGGMFCIVDVDNSWLSFSPFENEFKQFTQLAAQGQQKNGGNRFVGHSIGKLVHEAGFKSVNTQVQVITSEDIGVNNFLDITTGFKIKQIEKGNLAEGKELLQKIYSAADSSYAWGGVGVFVVAGIKE